MSEINGPKNHIPDSYLEAAGEDPRAAFGRMAIDSIRSTSKNPENIQLKPEVQTRITTGKA